MYKRIISLLLVIVTIFSLVVPAFAASDEYLPIGDDVSKINSWLSDTAFVSFMNAYKDIYPFLDWLATRTINYFIDSWWRSVDDALDYAISSLHVSYGQMSTSVMGNVAAKANEYLRNHNNVIGIFNSYFWSNFGQEAFFIASAYWLPNITVKQTIPVEEGGTSYYILFDSKSQSIISRRDGKTCYCINFGDRNVSSYSGKPPSSLIPSPPEEEDDDYKWLTEKERQQRSGIISIYEYGALSTFALNYPEHGAYVATADIGGVGYYVITRGDGRYLCQPGGILMCALTDSAKASSATTDTYNYYSEQTDNSTNVYDDGQYIESQLIDMSTMIATTNIDESTNYEIDTLLYDTDSHDYYLTLHDDDTYYTYNYQYTYNITNTYVTYIGSQEEYQNEAYQYYYELPDGRSSADLSADEVAALNFTFHDVVNYTRSATDTSLRSLYHFDQNTDDASYWNYQTSFVWNSGASISYMEDPGFEGALYLDNTAHSFTLNLPSGIPGSSDFTVQFRYYQASQPDTQDNIDNSLLIGGTQFLRWDEANLYRPSGQTSTPLAALQVGQWTEIAIIRSDGVTCIYYNGIPLDTIFNVNASYQGTITFSLGAASRAYSMIDELRVVNFAVAENGASYTPTAVPYDTNLVLVLPDSYTPVADEYWRIDDGNITWGGFLIDGVQRYDDMTSMSWSSSGALSGFVATIGLPADYYYDGFVRTAPDTFSLFESPFYDVPGSTYRQLSSWISSGYNSVLYFRFGTLGAGKKAADYNNKFVNIVDTDGNIYSGKISASGSGDSTVVTVDGNLKTFYAAYSGGASTDTKFRYISSNNMWSGAKASGVVLPASTDLVYLSISDKQLTSADVERITSIAPIADINKNTAAVRSDIPVSGYTVGGVRPTYPSRGNVWFSVSQNRIDGVYQYDGRAWVEVQARWWTGSRWILIYAFDIYTLEDLWDIADSEGVVTPIQTDTGFWTWWKTAWLSFTERFFALFDIDSSTSSSGDIHYVDSDDFESAGDDDFDDDIDDDATVRGTLISFISIPWRIVRNIGYRVFGGFSGVVSSANSAITDVSDVLDPSSEDGIFGIFVVNDVWGDYDE